MQILSYEPSMAGEAVAAYNDVVCGVPHCYPVAVDEFAAAVAPAAGDGDGPERLHADSAFVVRDGSAIRGFAHVAIERPKKDSDPERGIFRSIWYERGCRRAGQALLEAAESRLRELEVSQVVACHQDYRYRFHHLCHAYLSDHLDHVQALLGINGYKRCAGEVFLDWANFEAVEPEPGGVAANVSAKWTDGRGAMPNLCVQAHHDGKEIGVCSSVSCGEFSDAVEAQDWFITTWLGVEKEMQGKGLGRHLLQRALVEMRGAGYRHAAISTSWQNHRAFVFYSNFGYRVVDWTYAFGKKLGSP